jgi:flavin reductase (DIM6/NTAB) family NADH-FMN oxidoreductase RutF
MTCTVEEYRDLMSLFPAGVAVVTATSADGEPRGFTCSSLSSVAVAPPTLLMCIASDSPTLAAISQVGRCAVNLLEASARDTARLFATPDVDRFAAVAWEFSPGGLPHLVKDAIAVAECRAVRQIPVGDHTIVLGEVIETFGGDGGGQPLLYGLRTFASWPGPGPSLD